MFNACVLRFETTDAIKAIIYLKTFCGLNYMDYTLVYPFLIHVYNSSQYIFKKLDLFCMQESKHSLQLSMTLSSSCKYIAERNNHAPNFMQVKLVGAFYDVDCLC